MRTIVINMNNMNNIINPNKEGCTNSFCDYNLEKAPWICAGTNCPDHFIGRTMTKFNPDQKPKREKLKGIARKRRMIECFERDSYTCRECGRQHPIEQHALSPHHIKNRSQGGSDDLKNLATLCTVPCHRLVTDGLIENSYVN